MTISYPERFLRYRSGIPDPVKRAVKNFLYREILQIMEEEGVKKC